MGSCEKEINKHGIYYSLVTLFARFVRTDHKKQKNAINYNVVVNARIYRQNI